MKNSMNKERIDKALQDGEIKIGSKQYSITEGAARNLCRGCYFENKGCPKPAIDICNSGNYILNLK